MAIFITGGAGFVGSHLVELLLTATDRPLIVLDNFNAYYAPAFKRHNAGAWQDHPRVELIDGDFCDFDQMRRLFAERGVRQVVHLGGYGGVRESLSQPQTYVHANITGTLSLLDAARQAPVQRFLFASSSTVYGRGVPAPFREDGSLGVPLSPYGVTKRAAELLCLNYHQLHGVPAVVLRFFNVVGPRLRPELALAVFARRILRGQPIPLHGDGSVLRDFTSVRDICRGVLAALDAPAAPGEAINLGHNEPVPIRRLIELIEQAAGRAAVIETHPPRVEDMPVTCADLEKAGRLLNYAPQVSIEETVRDYVAWLRDDLARHPELYARL